MFCSSDLDVQLSGRSLLSHKSVRLLKRGHLIRTDIPEKPFVALRA